MVAYTIWISFTTGIASFIPISEAATHTGNNAKHAYNSIIAKIIFRAFVDNISCLNTFNTSSYTFLSSSVNLSLISGQSVKSIFIF